MKISQIGEIDDALTAIEEFYVYINDAWNTDSLSPKQFYAVRELVNKAINKLEWARAAYLFVDHERKHPYDDLTPYQGKG